MKRFVAVGRVAMISGLACWAMSTSAFGKNFNLDHEHVSDQLLVKFKSGVKSKAATRMLADAGAVVMHRFDSGAVLVNFGGKAGQAMLKGKAAALAQRSDVQYVEANQIVHAFNTVPNDPSFGQLYGLNNEGGTGGMIDADIDAPEAWDITTGSRNVVVGVIDTGVDYTHPDIASNYWTNPGESGLDEQGMDKKANGVDDDGNGYIDDWRGWDFVNNDNDPMDDNNHGTHCSGTIGGQGNDGVGVVGVNWNVSIVGLKFLSAAGGGTLADAVRAIEYGTRLGVTLTSNSWGGGGYSDTMDAAIRAAGDAGILFVAAAGNSASDNDNVPSYPASYGSDNIIAVAATDHNDQLANFSSYGATSVDVAAPGVDILSSIPNNGYDTFSGTSMATPHVSGVAALIKAAYPTATAAEIKARILNTADPVSALTGRVLSGGRVNAFNALEADTVAPGGIASIEVADTTITSVALRFSAAGDDGDLGRASRYEVRYAATAIDSDAAWEAATRAMASVVQGDDGMVTATVSGLAFNSEGYLAVKPIDNVGNVGIRSETVPFAVLGVRRVAFYDAETMDGATADMPWGLETVTGHETQVFSDSPGAGVQYANDANVSLTLNPMAVASAQLILSYSSAWSLEANYDFGTVEISTDGGVTWVAVDTVTGMAGWTTRTVDLSSHIGAATSLQLRFHLTSDYSITSDGWMIDDVQLFGPAR